MATSKLWSVSGSFTDVLGYIENDEKTFIAEEDAVVNVTSGVPLYDGRLIRGINCDPETATAEMRKVKDDYSKNKGVQAYHGYVSFGKQDNLTPVDCLAISERIAREMWGDRFQVVLAVHTNTNTLHCHFVVNSVSFVDGKKAQNNEKNYYALRRTVDRVCKEFGLTETKAYSKEKVPYSDILDRCAEARMEAAGNPVKLAEALESRGLKVLSDNRIVAPDGRRYATTKIGDGFEVKRIEKRDKKAYDEGSKPSFGGSNGPDLGVKRPGLG